MAENNQTQKFKDSVSALKVKHAELLTSFDNLCSICVSLSYFLEKASRKDAKALTIAAAIYACELTQNSGWWRRLNAKLCYIYNTAVAIINTEGIPRLEKILLCLKHTTTAIFTKATKVLDIVQDIVTENPPGTQELSQR